MDKEPFIPKNQASSPGLVFHLEIKLIPQEIDPLINICHLQTHSIAGLFVIKSLISLP